MSKTFKIVGDDLSDGYHTFDELYDHRCLLFLNLCLATPERARWKPDFEGWFCMYLETVAGQISYHLPNEMIVHVEKSIKRDDNYKWDGHTSENVRFRLAAAASGLLTKAFDA
jgi:hypothetical protein